MSKLKVSDITLPELEKKAIFCIMEVKRGTVIAIINEREDICEGYLLRKCKKNIEIDCFSVIQKELIDRGLKNKNYDLTKNFKEALKFLKNSENNKI
jgi:hypothetical protein